MAKNRSIIKLRGTLGEMTFYEDGGVNVVKTRTSLNGSKIKNDPAFKRTRENNQEFGGAAKVGKSFRLGFASVAKLMGDRYLTSRVTALMRAIIGRGTGVRGQREFSITTNSDVLKGFEFNNAQVFDSTFFAPTSIAFDPGRNITTWSIAPFNVDDFVRAPEGATHFRLVLAVGVLSNFRYDTGENGYVPVTATENELSGVAYGNYQELTGSTGIVDIVVNLGLSSALSNTVAVNAATGIVFYQEINGQMYELTSGNSMKIASIGLS